MRRENKLSFLAFALLAGMLSSATVSFAVAEDRPNILYIMSDDHAVTAIGAYGVKSDPLEMNNLYGDPQYTEIADRLKQQLKATRAEVKDSDADYPHVAEIISNHWNGGEEEAIRISHEVAKNPSNAKRQKGEKE